MCVITYTNTENYYNTWICFKTNVQVLRHLRYIVIRDVTILQYIDILQYSLLQYNTTYCLLQYIVIYCNICCHQSCKYPIITLQI